MGAIIDEYVKTHPTSRSLYDESVHHFPDGVTHDGRYLEPFPLYMARGHGSGKTDVDGRSYIDYVMGHGALILGHADPALVEAVGLQVAKGTHLGANTSLETAWAALVKELMPGVEAIRFHSSGTEAIAMTLRLARAFTRRDLVVKFNRHFHGWHDGIVTDPGRFSSSGIPVGVRSAVFGIEPGNPEELDRRLSDGDVAAVILEPTGAQMGSYPLSLEFLRAVREITANHGTLLIFDEVVTGFRVSKGGARVKYGIEPDLCALGKILAGGLPGAASAGSREIMDMIAHHGDDRGGGHWNGTRRIGHPGTFNANPLSAAAGVACLRQIAAGSVNSRADSAASRLMEGINRSFRDRNLPGFAHGVSSIVKVVFGMNRPEKPEELPKLHDQIAGSVDPALGRMFKLAMLNRGVDTMGGGRFIVSAVHSEDDVDETILAFDSSLGALASEGFLISSR